MLFLEEKPITKERAQGRHPPPDDCQQVRARRRRFGVQEQGRAVSPRRRRRLSARPARHSAGAGSGPGQPRKHVEAARRTTTRKFCSLAFKLWSDPFVGKLVFFRVYTGKLSKGDTVYNPRTNKRERISRIIQIQADKREDIDTCYSGDIAAIVGIKNITTGDTLCDEDHRHPARAAVVPRPGHLDGHRAEDQGRPGKDGQRAPASVAEEDPTFRVFTNVDTGQTIIAGMGELHLEIIRDRMMREFKVDANSGKPQIAYRETITATADRRRQAHQAVRRSRSVRPRHRQRPAQRTRQGSRPSTTRSSAARSRRNTSPPARRASKKPCSTASSAAIPVVDVNVDIIDGSYHDVDSNEMAFKMAGNFRGQGRLQEGQGHPARAHHEGGSRDARKITRATSWVT